MTREIFERTQAIRESRALAREKIHKHPHYLKGSLFCGQCGSRLGATNAHGNGGLYRYFYCTGRQKRRAECKFKHVEIEEIERRVELLWRRVHLPAVRIEEIRETATSELGRVYDLSQQELSRQQRRLADLERQRAKAKDAYYSDAMGLDEFRAEQRRIAREQDAAERIMRQCQMEQKDLEDAVDEALALLGNAYELYQRATLTIRRQLNQAVFGPLRVYERDVQADLAQPFAALLAPDLPSGGDVAHGDVDKIENESGTDEEAGNANRLPLAGGGSNFTNLVAPTGFEPALPP